MIKLLFISHNHKPYKLVQKLLSLDVSQSVLTSRDVREDTELPLSGTVMESSYGTKEQLWDSREHRILYDDSEVNLVTIELISSKPTVCLLQKL